MRNSAFDEVLEREVYQQPALMPPSPWLGRAQPGKPKLTVANGASGSPLEIRWAPSGSGKPWLWLLQTRTGGEWTKEILPATRTSRVWNGSAAGGRGGFSGQPQWRAERSRRASGDRQQK